MKLVVSTHAGVLAVNRKIFLSLAEKTGWDITLLVPRHWKGDLITELCYSAEPDEAILTVKPLKTHFSGDGSFFFYRDLPKDLNPDLLFLDEEPWSLNALQLYRHFPSNKKVFYTKQNIKKTLPPPFNWIQTMVLKKSVGAFAVSDEVENVLRKKKYTGPVQKLPHSFDPTMFRKPSTEERENVREKYHIKKDATVVAYVGRLTEEKGIHDLLESIKNICSKKEMMVSNLIFLIVGNGELKPWIQKQINFITPGKVIFKDALLHHQIGALLGVIDILVLPSRTTATWKEQFGRILVEAWASGAAVIGSDSGEIPNLINKAKGGLIFHEKSVDDLSEKIETMIKNPMMLQDFKANGHRYVSTHLTHDAVADELAVMLKRFFISDK